ncbi:MAG: S41 family peptidase [Elusimicrobiota bacterium]
MKMRIEARSISRRALSSLLCLGLIASCSPCASAQHVASRSDVARVGSAGSAAAGPAVAQQALFLDEMNLALQGLNDLTPTPVSPSAAAPKVEPLTALNPEAAVLYMTALSASPAAQEEHAARQVLIEYAARPSLRAEIENILKSPSAMTAGSAGTIARLKEFGAKLAALDKPQKRVLLEGLISLRKKLYTSTSKAATIDGTRENLAQYFENSGRAAQPPPSAVTVGEASGAGAMGLLKAAAPKTGKDRSFIVDALPKPDMAATEATNIIDSVMQKILANYIHPITLERLLLGLAKKAGIDGMAPASSQSGPESRREFLTALARMLKSVISGGTDSPRNAFQVADTFIRAGITPVKAPQDLYSIIKAIVAETKDMYSRFLDPVETRNSNLRMKSSFAGIGILFNGSFLIVSVVPQGPADKAGVKADDRIVAVNGVPVSGSDTSEKLSGMLRGDPDTPVEITVSRDGKELTAKAVRRVMPSPNVFADMLPGRPDVGYLYFNGFHEDTGPVFLGKIRSLKQAGMKSLIIDLRYNPGGLLSTALSIAQLFLRKWQVVYHLQEGRRIIPTVSSMDGEFVDLPVTVLVNKESASASELLSAALQDNGRAEIIGERTYGKGVGQRQISIPMSDAAATLTLTTMQWFTPNNLSIHSDVRGRGGVVPTVALTGDKKDLKAGYESIRHGLHGDGKWAPDSDPWIQKAADLAQAKAGATE